ncbi:MAG: hypothetical protein U0T74_08915 [Chitinophagales bacterium]
MVLPTSLRATSRKHPLKHGKSQQEDTSGQGKFQFLPIGFYYERSMRIATQTPADGKSIRTLVVNCSAKIIPQTLRLVSEDVNAFISSFKIG